ncbi:unnamed protein product [Kuraishia capsulata CBS 1993]|uniref:CID domain-containing protein n=1 Tax=Kuraishia capsulata CBS 1993 TaxID=1382522 RepID=W6MFR1_9ASCO|nr:uncharacterized protein KUCA_T00000178001 [Kuraishia capsulata CBS 1993]CDK24218.1 unnamed protein product [Kuraishia capsulata CBS 1993]
MAYSREAVEEKLDRLDESQASIVAIAQWCLFHQRNAKETVSIWSDAMKNTPKKRLALFYLANEVIQQSRAHRRTEFLMYFSEFLPPVLEEVFQSLNAKDQARFKKVIGVWKERAIFSDRIFKNLYGAIEGGNPSAVSIVEKAVQNVSKKKESPISDDEPDLAPELIPVSNLYNKLSTKTSSNTGKLVKHKKLYDASFNSEHLPAPDKYISQLVELEKLNLVCSNNTLEAIEVRKDILAALNRLVESQKHWVETEEKKLENLQLQLKATKQKQDELKDFIDNESGEEAGVVSDDDDDDAPQYAASDSDDDDSGSKRKNVSVELNSSNTKKAKLASEELVVDGDEPELVTKGSLTPEPEEGYDPGADEDIEAEHNIEANEEMNTDLANLLSKLT